MTFNVAPGAAAPSAWASAHTTTASLRMKSRLATLALVTAVWSPLSALAQLNPGQLNHGQVSAGQVNHDQASHAPFNHEQMNVTTYHYDNGRSGWNPYESTLTPVNVNTSQFGKLFSHKVDGEIYAQPLYVSQLNIPGKGVHNVVFVATEGDSVYAFDADGNAGGNAQPLWHAGMIELAHGAAPGATTVDSLHALHCPAIVPRVGITSTPVIDLKHGVLFVEAYSKEGTKYIHRIHALEIATGEERSGSPIVVTASVKGLGDGRADGSVRFDAMHQLNRPGLLLVNDVLYVAYGTQCDHGRSHGWVFAYGASNLAMLDAFVTTPNGSWGGIWMSGAGLAADDDGNLFIATGNGTFNDDAAAKDLAQTIFKMALDKDSGKFTVLDYFAPFNHLLLNRHDRDLGSGGVLLLPEQPGIHPHLLAQVGKEGKMYLLDRDQMTQNNQHVCNTNCTSDPQILQEIEAAGEGMWSMPVYWNSALYFWGSMSPLKALRLQDGRLKATPFSVSKERYEHPGANLSISSNGSQNAILWAIRTEKFDTRGPAVLAAYDPADLSHLLYASDLNKLRDRAGGAIKFTVPIVVNGKVYIGAAGELDAYGLLPNPATIRPLRPK